jgi:O-antigen ligase
MVRRLPAPASAAFVLGGLALGIAVDRIRSPVHTSLFAVSLPSATCEAPFTAAPSSELRLPASLLAGYRADDASAPPPLRDTSLHCRLSPEADRTIATCAVRGPDAALVRRIAAAAQADIGRLETPLATEMANVRLIVTCGPEYFAKLARAPQSPAGQVDPKGKRPETRELLAARAPLMGDARPWPAPPDSPPARSGNGALFGALLGALIASLAAAWGAREQELPPLEPPGSNRMATAALAGLMLTAGMDRALLLTLGRFNVRAGQICALVLLGAVIAERRRLGRALAVPAAPMVTGLAYLSLCAASAMASDFPLKSAAYLGWASFDLLVVLVGVAAYATGRDRLEVAFRWWVGGMALAAGMGALQIGSWLAGRPAPLLSSDVAGFPRISGFNYEPAFFALYLLPGALVLLSRFVLLGDRARGSGLLAGALLCAVALSTSRSGWIGIGVGLALLAARARARLGRGALRRLGFSAAALAAALGLVLLAWPRMRASAATMARMAVDLHEVTSSGPRLESMRQALVLFSRYPALGVGFGNYGAYVLAHPELPNFAPQDAKGLVTTNLYLEVAAETGAVGLAAALALLVALLAPLWRSVRAQRGAAPDAALATAEGLRLASLVVFGVLFHFNQTLWRLDVWVLLSLSLSAALATSARAAPAPAREEDRALGGSGSAAA